MVLRFGRSPAARHHPDARRPPRRTGGMTQATKAVTQCPDRDASDLANVGIGTLGHAGVQRVKRTGPILEEHAMRSILRTLVLLLALAGLAPSPGLAQAQPSDRFQPDELVEAGHRFFGGVSRGLATI